MKRQQDLQSAGSGTAVARKKPISSNTAHEEVYIYLRRLIISGQLEPGKALSVRGLAADCNVSAMPAREAIKSLVALGALEQTATRRIMVSKMTPGKFRELIIARRMLEPALASLALERLSTKAKQRDALAAKLTLIDSRLDDAIKAGDVSAYGKWNSEFHFALYEAADAPVMLGLVESLWLQIGPFMRIVLGRRGTSALVDQHQEAIAAIKDCDALKLEEAIRGDIMDGMSHIAIDVAGETGR